MNDCIFCKIVNKDLPSNKVYENDKVLAFLDISPVNLGHTLVIPKEHFRNALETPDEIVAEIMKIGKKIGKALQADGAEGINITLNNEPASGQVIFHTHLHVIPRFKNDGHSVWTGTTKYKEGEREEMADKIGSLIN
jgi:histidine triad (HIT) family protein